jgi:hypothetical protein
VRRGATTHVDEEHLKWELERLDQELADIRWASASAVGIDAAAAREEIRDAIGLLRLYQRSLVNMNLDYQTFGLEPEVGHAVIHSFTMRKGRIGLRGGLSAGIPAIGWTFTDDQIGRFSQLPAYAYLDRALRAAEKDDLQKRATTALRFLSLATAMLPEPVRVVLVATAFEELLADLQKDNRRTVMARRAAYLTCAQEFEQGYGPGGRPACLFLASKKSDEVKARRAAVVARGGEEPYCSWYYDVLILCDTRDRVLHERLESLRKSAAANFEAQADEAIRYLVAWAERTGATTIEALDDEIDAYVAANYRDWPSPPVEDDAAT